MSNAWHGGKGSAARPFSVSQDEYNNRWDAIFQRDIPKEQPAAEADDKLSRYNDETKEVKEKLSN